MKSLPLRQAEKQLLALAGGDSGEGRLTLLTAKKDRSLTVIVSGGVATVREEGFENRETAYDAGDRSHLKKALREAFDREFPRSHRLYVD